MQLYKLIPFIQILNSHCFTKGPCNGVLKGSPVRRYIMTSMTKKWDRDPITNVNRTLFQRYMYDLTWATLMSIEWAVLQKCVETFKQSNSRRKSAEHDDFHKKIPFTHWGRMTHICFSKLIIIVSDNGLSPSRHLAIVWINAGILLTGPLGTNFSEIFIEIYLFSFKKLYLNI